jgi:glycosyltransferase involved in cell wall biosynthesis
MTLRIGLVGPLPPPEGGMANQCLQLSRLLAGEGIDVEVVRTNEPYRPAVIEKLRFARALFRLLPYAWRVWRMTGRVDAVHVFANSGWAWHLCAAPAVLLSRLRGTPVIVNYRGGAADAFLERAPSRVRRTIAAADALVVPSGFLEGVFARHGLRAVTIPNVVDLARFKPAPARGAHAAPHVIVTRNLEPLYDVPTALRALAIVARRFPGARMTVAGTGPERASLGRLAQELGIESRVRFAGRVDNAQIAGLYAEADVMVNPSTVDNMPISVLEAFASGVPVVSTNVGGVPFMARHEHTALLVPPRDPDAMAGAITRVLAESEIAQRLAANGLEEARRYAWPAVRELWLAQYRSHARTPRTVVEGS